jgi:hypothetical protein
VSAMGWAISCTKAPRERAFTSSRSPCSIGPTLTRAER